MVSLCTSCPKGVNDPKRSFCPGQTYATWNHEGVIAVLPQRDLLSSFNLKKITSNCDDEVCVTHSWLSHLCGWPLKSLLIARVTERNIECVRVCVCVCLFFVSNECGLVWEQCGTLVAIGTTAPASLLCGSGDGCGLVTVLKLGEPNSFSPFVLWAMHLLKFVEDKCERPRRDNAGNWKEELFLREFSSVVESKIIQTVFLFCLRSPVPYCYSVTCRHNSYDKWHHHGWTPLTRHGVCFHSDSPLHSWRMALSQKKKGDNNAHHLQSFLGYHN